VLRTWQRRDLPSTATSLQLSALIDIHGLGGGAPPPWHRTPRCRWNPWEQPAPPSAGATRWPRRDAMTTTTSRRYRTAPPSTGTESISSNSARRGTTRPAISNPPLYARVYLSPGPDGPAVLEVETIDRLVGHPVPLAWLTAQPFAARPGTNPTSGGRPPNRQLVGAQRARLLPDPRVHRDPAEVVDEAGTPNRERARGIDPATPDGLGCKLGNTVE
jgi:hypothetical protein